MSLEPEGVWIVDPGPPTRPPSPGAEVRGLRRATLRCPCGSRGFRASGRPHVVGSAGSYFWRSVTRVWREARQTLRDGDPLESPFALPLTLDCAECGRGGEVYAGTEEAADQDPAARRMPREAYRCRVCRNAVMGIEIGIARTSACDPADPEAASEAIEQGLAEVWARCHACRHEARIAWLGEEPTPQQVRLDTLYGRR